MDRDQALSDLESKYKILKKKLKREKEEKSEVDSKLSEAYEKLKDQNKLFITQSQETAENDQTSIGFFFFG